MKINLLSLTLSWLLTPLIFAAEPLVIADFENNIATKTGGVFKSEIVSDKEHVKEGEYALKLDIDYDLEGVGIISWKLPPGSDVATAAGSISLWVFGGGNEATLQFSVTARDKGVFSTVQTINWEGWQELEIPLSDFKFNKYAEQPPDASQSLDPSELINLNFMVYRGISKQLGQSTIYLDSIRLLP